MTIVPRPLTKLTDEQQELLRQAIEAAKKSAQDQQSADASRDEAWRAILAARNGGVPDDVVCKQTGFSRATLNRKFGPRPDEG